MDGLQRSTTSFRRQGSSGLVWDDKFLGELNQLQKEVEQQKQESQEPQQEQDNKSQVKEVKAPRLSVNTIERSRSSGGGRGYRTGKVSPAIEPPSPKVSACGFCSSFGKQTKKGQRTKPGKRRSR